MKWELCLPYFHIPEDIYVGKYLDRKWELCLPYFHVRGDVYIHGAHCLKGKWGYIHRAFCLV